MRLSIAAAVLIPAVSVMAENFTVSVGAQGALAFSPPNITAAIGDNIMFTFFPKNHSVTQSSFANPCTRLTTPAAGIDSGFQSVDPAATSSPSWTITVNSTDPLWFYCAQTLPVSHCQQGMVFAVNAPADKTFDSFQNAAKSGSAAGGNSTSTGGPSGPSGSSGSGSLPPATSGAGGSSGSGTTAGGPASTSTSAGAGTTSNSALRSTGNAAGLLSVVGLLVGLTL